MFRLPIPTPPKAMSQIDTFLSITATSDRDVAERFMEMAGGDVENAIAIFMENGGGAGAFGSHSSDADMASRLQSEAYQEPVREPMQARRERLVDFDDFTPSVFREPSATMFNNAPSSIFNQRFEVDEDQEMTDDEEDDFLTSTQKRLAKIFRPPFDLMTREDLEGARKIAQREKKWIMINIQDPTEFQCQVLNRDFWSNQDIKQIVKQNFIFLQFQKDSQSGQEFEQFYPFDEFPHIAILDPITGEKFKSWSGAPIIPGWIEEVVEFLNRFSLDPGHINPTVQHTRKVDFDSMSEEQQIELAMKRSVGGGREDPINLDSDTDESFQAESDEESSDDDEAVITRGQSEKDSSETESVEEDEAQLMEDLTDEELFATILPAPHTEPPAGPETTRIQIRTGDGKRVVHRFSLNEKVRDLFAFVKNDFDKTRIFQLTSHRVNLIKEVNKTVEEAGLKNASVLIEFLD